MRIRYRNPDEMVHPRPIRPYETEKVLLPERSEVPEPNADVDPPVDTQAPPAPAVPSDLSNPPPLPPKLPLPQTPTQPFLDVDRNRIPGGRALNVRGGGLPPRPNFGRMKRGNQSMTQDTPATNTVVDPPPVPPKVPLSEQPKKQHVSIARKPVARPPVSLAHRARHGSTADGSHRRREVSEQFLPDGRPKPDAKTLAEMNGDPVPRDEGVPPVDNALHGFYREALEQIREWRISKAIRQTLWPWFTQIAPWLLLLATWAIMLLEAVSGPFLSKFSDFMKVVEYCEVVGYELGALGYCKA